MATDNTTYTPFRPVHPCEIIKGEIKARSMSQKELAHRMGMQTSNLSRLLKGENLTIATAQKLEEALDIPADFWMRLQAQYDKDLKTVAARNEVERKAIAAESILANTLNLNELYKRLNISSSAFINEKLLVLEESLGFDPQAIRNKDYAQSLNYNYKKSDKNEVDEKNQLTWLTLAYIESRRNSPGKPFVQGNAQLAAQEIATKVHSEGIRESDIKSILNSFGIAYSVVPKLEKTPIDAASMSLRDYPAIITTHRFNDMSRLVFNVLHELGHIEKHLPGDNSEVFVSGDSYSSDSQKEREANDFAQEILISKKLWNSMMDSSSMGGIRYGNIVEKLRALSEENNLNPDIVIWRWKYESQIFQLKGTRPAPIK